MIKVTLEIENEKYVFEGESIEKINRYMEWICADYNNPIVSETFRSEVNKKALEELRNH